MKHPKSCAQRRILETWKGEHAIDCWRRRDVIMNVLQDQDPWSDDGVYETLVELEKEGLLESRVLQELIGQKLKTFKVVDQRDATEWRPTKKGREWVSWWPLPMDEDDDKAV